MAESVELCRMAADEGIETIVATPHVLRGRWQNTSRTELTQILEDLRAAVGDRPRIVLGSEYSSNSPATVCRLWFAIRSIACNSTAGFP
jgi:dihydrodipicolinate synthase/N-acetylneuraminate lyase